MFFRLICLVSLTSLLWLGCGSGSATNNDNSNANVSNSNNENTTTSNTNNTNSNENTTSGNSNNANSTGEKVSVQADVWADNWFAFYLGNTLVKEDSVSITTERSFNKETFTFEGTYPLVLNFVAKDFKQDDTGLEYIGKPNQQMGDAGLIAQFKDAATGKVIAVTNANWKCLVIHEAPLDKSCAKESSPTAGKAPCEFKKTDEPSGWKDSGFDDSSWTNATEYTPAQVRPKDGYDQVTWDATAKLIWTGDLETHNTILCRIVINKP